VNTHSLSYILHNCLLTVESIYPSSGYLLISMFAWLYISLYNCIDRID